MSQLNDKNSLRFASRQKRPRDTAVTPVSLTQLLGSEYRLMVSCFVDSRVELFVREDVLSMTPVMSLVCLGKTLYRWYAQGDSNL